MCQEGKKGNATRESDFTLALQSCNQRISGARAWTRESVRRDAIHTHRAQSPFVLHTAPCCDISVLYSVNDDCYEEFDLVVDSLFRRLSRHKQGREREGERDLPAEARIAVVPRPRDQAWKSAADVMSTEASQ